MWGFFFIEMYGSQVFPAMFGTWTASVRILSSLRGLGIECGANFRKDAQISNYDKSGQTHTLPCRLISRIPGFEPGDVGAEPTGATFWCLWCNGNTIACGAKKCRFDPD